LLQGHAAPADLLQDGVGHRRSDKGLQITVVQLQIVLDGNTLSSKVIAFLVMLPVLIVIYFVFKHFDGHDQWPKYKESELNKRRREDWKKKKWID
jgi:amino acid permease